MLVSALSCLLEGCHVSAKEEEQDIFFVQTKLCAQLRMLLKMLALTLSMASSKAVSSSPQSSLSSKRSGDGGKLKELYKMSLKSISFTHLCDMYSLDFIINILCLGTSNKPKVPIVLDGPITRGRAKLLSIALTKWMEEGEMEEAPPMDLISSSCEDKKAWLLVQAPSLAV